MKIQSEISTLQSELDRILYLLKIADPAGEAARKRDAKPAMSKLDGPSTLASNNIPMKSPSTGSKEKGKSEKHVSTLPSQITKAENPTEKVENIEERENKIPSYVPTKPLLLGAIKEDESVNKLLAAKPIVDEEEGPDHFIDYKDRKKVLCPTYGNEKIEDAAPGLILRKRKHTDEPRAQGSNNQESTLAEAETAAAEAVALLLKHKRGYFGVDDAGNDMEQDQDGSPTGNKSQPKRVLGPEKPAFLKNNKEFESWVPPKGQSGDGRTSLNDKFGY